MRKPLIAGNWKMNKTPTESVAYARELATMLPAREIVECVVAPTALALAAVAEILRGSGIGISAQDAHHEPAGAYTAQVSAAMLDGLAEYVILGHSECRAYLGETDERVNRKLHAALACGLRPIVAVGESLAQFEAGATREVVSGQLHAALAGVPTEDLEHTILAYEPVWAIGTGRNASAEIAAGVIGGCARTTLAELHGAEAAEHMRILYGGSVKPANMAEYMAEPEIDGALVGGASLVVDDFCALVAIAAREKGLT